METTDGGDITLEDIPDFDLGDWEYHITTENGQDILACLSPNRQHKITVRTVVLQSAEVPTGFLIEFYEGDEAYTRNRTQTANTIAPDPDLVPRTLRDLIAGQTGTPP